MSQITASRGRPRVVLITGEPGTGKTTLGVTLARELRVPFVARDDVRAGMFFTAGAWTERPGTVPPSDDAVDALLRIVETMADLGVSCVVEYVVRRSRPRDLDRIVAVAECVVVRTWCRDALTRFTRRSNADRLLNRQPVLDSLGYSTIDEHTRDAARRMSAISSEMQEDFEVPVLRVNTDDGYEPEVEAIVEFATKQHSRPPA